MRDKRVLDMWAVEVLDRPGMLQ